MRVVERDGLPWFVAADVCRALGITNASQAIRQLDEDEKGIRSTYTLGGDQEALIVSESGLFSLILRSRDAMKAGTLPHRFRRWVTGEVLPALRSAGQFTNATGPNDGSYILPETTRLRMVKEARQTFGVRAAGQLWWSLGLPTVPAMWFPPSQHDLFALAAR